MCNLSVGENMCVKHYTEDDLFAFFIVNCNNQIHDMDLLRFRWITENCIELGDLFLSFLLTHSLIHHFETVPNSKKLQTKTEMWLLKDFKKQIAWKTLWEKGEIAHFEQFHLFLQCFPKAYYFGVLKWLYMEERIKKQYHLNIFSFSNVWFSKIDVLDHTGKKVVQVKVKTPFTTQSRLLTILKEKFFETIVGIRVNGK